MVCKPRATYTEAVIERACRSALIDKQTGDALVLTDVPKPSIWDRNKGGVKATAFLVVTTAGVIFVVAKAAPLSQLVEKL
ncbi:MAG: hypothetical protein CUN57_03830, partial [Phototrophicales bacterium]